MKTKIKNLFFTPKKVKSESFKIQSRARETQGDDPDHEQHR